MTRWAISDRVTLGTPQAQARDEQRESGARQRATAAELLRRLRIHPGQILADEVGMGKTFVALAVAASVVLENPDSGPVVVMVPPGVADKWPKEWGKFAGQYLRPGVEISHQQAHNGVEFLRLLDDGPETAARIITLSHGAFHRQLNDPWVKLALIRQVVLRRPTARRAVERFGRDVIDLPRSFDDDLVPALIATPLDKWRRVVEAHGYQMDDDPVPRALIDALGGVDRVSLLTALEKMPKARSKNFDQRIKEARQSLNSVIGELWKVWLAKAEIRSPLLILDEAHHTKNSATQLARLFSSDEDGAGALFGQFERLLFLTATPFQLGHHELIDVLRRFDAVAWGAAPLGQDQFHEDLADLEERLENAQRSANLLDESWGRLRSDDVPTRDQWWLHATPADPPRLARVITAYRETDKAMRRAEAVLSTWVIRHRKPDRFDDRTDRRVYLRGAQIVDPGMSGGIDIGEDGLLPFLLAGRAQVAFQLARRRGDLPPRARSLFADGLASSFEAYRDTSNGGGLDDDASQLAVAVDDPEIRWYLDAIAEELPRHEVTRHPKMAPTVDRVVDLWWSGQKVVVFCHFRHTGTALRKQISIAIERRLEQHAARRMKCKPEEVWTRLRPVARRLEGTPALIAEIAATSETATPAEREVLADALSRFLRSPVTLALYGDDKTNLRSRKLLHRKHAGESLGARLQRVIHAFDRLSGDEERSAFLNAISTIRSGRYTAAVDGSQHEDADHDGADSILPIVRLANGAVDRPTRRRLLEAFNSPLMPDVLVASSVLAEGVDLHLECRHVIHHDLDWNPSTLEQRTGRVDRIGSLSERSGEPVVIYLPYLAGTQDEKMYRVVRDRERWFQVVMGNRHELDEQAIEDRASRVELPEEAARRLAFRLAL